MLSDHPGRREPTGSTQLRAIHCPNGALPEHISPALPPFLPQLVAEIAALHSAPSDARGRRYQLDIARNGHFFVTSPRSGARIPSGDSIILPDRTTFYRFPACPDLLLGAANLGKGYPLTAIVLLGERVLIQVGERTWGVREDHVAAVEEILREPRWWPPSPARTLQIFTGDPNFAHHAWNQLAAFEATLQEAREGSAEVRVFATFQPLGRLDELFPNLLRRPIQWQDASIPAACNAPGRVSVNPGGFLLTDFARARLWSLAKRSCGIRTRRLISRLRAHHPVVWISVRTRNRTPTNQRSFILALCRRLLSSRPRCAIILDGHTLPEDFLSNPSYDADDAIGCVRADLAEIRAIRAQLEGGGMLRSSQAVIEACGLNLLDAVALARATDFYVCHHGTVQHKIGWLTAKPGVVHSNRRTLEHDVARWVADQCESGPVPLYLPAHLIDTAGVDSTESDEIRSRLFESYLITNEEQATRFVLDAVASEVPARFDRWPALARSAAAALARARSRFRRPGSA